MSTRETKTITTPNGHAVVVYTYFTAGEQRALRRIFMRKFETRGLPTGSKEEIQRKIEEEQSGFVMSGEDIMETQEQTLRFLVVSVDGCDREQAYDRLMELRPADADYVLAELDKLTGDTSEAAQEKKGDWPTP